MPGRVIKAAVAGLVAAGGLLVVGPPADACTGLNCPQAEITEDGVIAQARAEMNELNAGYPGGPPPTNCTDEHELVPEDGNDIVEYHGWLRWVPNFENDPTPPDGTSNEWYRHTCYLPDMPPRTGEPLMYHSRRFDAVTPENIARVAVDDMLAGIPDHAIETSPADASLVAVDTWFWVTGEATTPQQAIASVPGTTVVATAEPGGLHLDFGGGEPLDCGDFGVPWSAGATSECVHAFQTAGIHQVTASILWRGSYTIDGGAPIPIETAVERTTTFDVTVNEAQAINTR